MSDIFIKLVDGAFSGYEIMQGDLRKELRTMFFSLTNNTPMHCDPDFSPLTTAKAVRLLVKTLSHGESFVPLHVGLRSDESHSIQVADIICGSVKTIINEKHQETIRIRQLGFYNKLKGSQKDAKVFYWINEKSTQVSEAVVG